MFGEPLFLNTWSQLLDIVRHWREEEDGSDYPLEGNKLLLKIQSLRIFENLFKVWSENVPVKKDAAAMSEMRGHRIRLARASTSAPDVNTYFFANLLLG